MLGLMVRFMDETIMSNIRYISKDLFAPFTSQIKNSRNVNRPPKVRPKSNEWEVGSKDTPEFLYSFIRNRIR